MSAYFLDTSAIVKRFAREKGSGFVIDLMRPSVGNTLYAARITEIEVCAALSRRRKGKTIDADKAARAIARWQRIFGHNFQRVILSDGVLQEAFRLSDQYALRGYDAIQLACAISADRARMPQSSSALTLVSADNELNAIAQTEGLSVENPNNY